MEDLLECYKISKLHNLARVIAANLREIRFCGNLLQWNAKTGDFCLGSFSSYLGFVRDASDNPASLTSVDQKSDGRIRKGRPRSR